MFMNIADMVSHSERLKLFRETIKISETVVHMFAMSERHQLAYLFISGSKGNDRKSQCHR